VSDVERLLLQGVQDDAVSHEADEMAGRSDRQLTEVDPVRRPVAERKMPGQRQQAW